MTFGQKKGYRASKSRGASEISVSWNEYFDSPKAGCKAFITLKLHLALNQSLYKTEPPFPYTLLHNCWKIQCLHEENHCKSRNHTVLKDIDFYKITCSDENRDFDLLLTWYFRVFSIKKIYDSNENIYFCYIKEYYIDLPNFVTW